jgi:hypothetical protein
MKSFHEYRYGEIFNEVSAAGRYSIEVNYRTSTEEVLDNFAKICLGYVSAAMKNLGFHCRQVYEQRPFRVLVSTRNWDDGEWIGVVSWHAAKHCFVLSKGFYNKDRKTVSIQSSQHTKSQEASEIVKELRNLLHEIKEQPDRHMDKMKPVPMKRGPKNK